MLKKEQVRNSFDDIDLGPAYDVPWKEIKDATFTEGAKGPAYRDLLSEGALNAACSPLAYIKGCVRLYNKTPSDIKLTLTISTVSTEHYTGD